MNERFFELSPEKQTTMLNAAMAVFAHSTYKKAATTEIAEKAGISKGLLFHYFENKKSLYLFLYNYAVRFLVDEMSSMYDWDESDFFRRLKKAQACKTAICIQHPNLFAFLTKAYLDGSEEIKEELNQSFHTVLINSSASFLKLVDCSKFKDGVDPSMVLNLILWASDGYMRSKPEEQLGDAAALNEEFMHYLDMLEKTLYKEEHLSWQSSKPTV